MTRNVVALQLPNAAPQANCCAPGGELSLLGGVETPAPEMGLLNWAIWSPSYFLARALRASTRTRSRRLQVGSGSGFRLRVATQTAKPPVRSAAGMPGPKRLRHNDWERWNGWASSSPTLMRSTAPSPSVSMRSTLVVPSVSRNESLDGPEASTSRQDQVNLASTTSSKSVWSPSWAGRLAAATLAGAMDRRRSLSGQSLNIVERARRADPEWHCDLSQCGRSSFHLGSGLELALFVPVSELRGRPLSIRVMVTLSLQEGFAEQVKTNLKASLVDTRSFEGCEEIAVLQNADAPDTLVILQQWATREHYDTYAAWRTGRGDMDNMAKISAKPYETAFFDYVQA